MKGVRIGQMRMGSLVAAVLLALLGVGILLDAAAIGEGIRRGLEVCGGVLIPALFPFMVLCCYLTRTDAARILSLPLRPLTTRLLRLPAELGAVVLLSLIGGYPVGAKMIANLLDDGKIDLATAERMLCICVNASPSFVISAVGVGMLADQRAGAVLFAGQTLATLLIGAVVSRKAPAPGGVPQRRRAGAPSAGTGGAFVPAVTDASSAMLTMCAFAVLFCGVLALMGHLELPQKLAALFHIEAGVAAALAAGLCEVTSGCLASAAVGGEASIMLLSICCSFCGLSILFQIMSCFKREKPRFLPMVVCRLAHCVVATLITLPLYRLFCGDVPAWLPHTPPPVLHSNARTVVVTLCLLAMCSMLVLQSGKKSKSKSK